MGGPTYGYGMGGYQPQMGVGSIGSAPTQPADPSAFNTAYGVSQPPQNRPLPTAPIPPLQNSDYVQRPGSGWVPPAQPSGGGGTQPAPMGVSMGGGDPYAGQQQQMDQQQQQYSQQPRPYGYGSGFLGGLLRPYNGSY